MMQSQGETNVSADSLFSTADFMKFGAGSEDPSLGVRVYQALFGKGMEEGDFQRVLSNEREQEEVRQRNEWINKMLGQSHPDGFQGLIDS